EGLDVLYAVTSLSQQGLVDDNAVGLDNVGNAQHRVAVLEGVFIAGELTVNSAVAEVIAVVLPVGKSHGAVDLGEGGRVALAHLAHKVGLVLAGGGATHGDGNAGLLGVELGQLLPLGSLLGLEVQVVDFAAGGSAVIAGLI